MPNRHIELTIWHSANIIKFSLICPFKGQGAYLLLILIPNKIAPAVTAALIAIAIIINPVILILLSFLSLKLQTSIRVCLSYKSFFKCKYTVVSAHRQVFRAKKKERSKVLDIYQRRFLILFQHSYRRSLSFFLVGMINNIIYYGWIFSSL